MSCVSQYIFSDINYTDWKNIIDQLSLCSIVLNILTIGINDCKFTKQFGLFCKYNSYYINIKNTSLLVIMCNQN